ncbi:unnamed protein product [marine sediment metagenome]|uniref:DUF4177 domain-containing protein n=1 Tax=marine sediment metagenome TaxID=412755 RepID=X1G3N0_9ZZZZ
MGVWKAKVVSSKRNEFKGFEIEIAQLLNAGWTVIGYSFSDRFQHALLKKETKEGKD